MPDSPSAAPTSPYRELVTSLIRLLNTDLVRWLDENPNHARYASTLVELMRKPRLVKQLQIHPTDLFRSDHLSSTELSELARARKCEKEELNQHLEECSLCDAIVETGAVHMVLMEWGRNDLSCIHWLFAKTPEAATDNEKWFAGGPGPRERP